MKPVHAEECRALIAQWDQGGPVQTIEMGGLGVQYEQVIQTMVMEFMRASIDVDFHEEKEKADALFKVVRDNVMKTLDDELGGVTGAMFGAACNLSAHYLFIEGYAGALAALPTRVILVTNPKPKEPQ